jgi:hypothetical protein
MPAPYPFILTIVALVTCVGVIIYLANNLDDSETPETTRSGSTPGQKCQYCGCHDWEMKRPLSEGAQMIAGILTSFRWSRSLNKISEQKVCKSCGKKWPTQK